MDSSALSAADVWLLKCLSEALDKSAVRRRARLNIDFQLDNDKYRESLNTTKGSAPFKLEQVFCVLQRAQIDVKARQLELLLFLILHLFRFQWTSGNI